MANGTRTVELSEADVATLEDASMFFVVALMHSQTKGEKKAADTAARILALLTRLTTKDVD